jgi:hypothetical protein
MNPAIIPIRKHQIGSMVVYPMWIEICLSRFLTAIADADLATRGQLFVLRRRREWAEHREKKASGMELPEVVTCYPPGMNSGEQETRIKKIRDRAEEIRADAAKVRNPKIRASMLNIARSYDNAADLLARILAKND